LITALSGTRQADDRASPSFTLDSRPSRNHPRTVFTGRSSSVATVWTE
jgi:hypothetical protein